MNGRYFRKLFDENCKEHKFPVERFALYWKPTVSKTYLYISQFYILRLYTWTAFECPYVFINVSVFEKGKMDE